MPVRINRQHDDLRSSRRIHSPESGPTRSEQRSRSNPFDCNSVLMFSIMLFNHLDTAASTKNQGDPVFFKRKNMGASRLVGVQPLPSLLRAGLANWTAVVAEIT